MANARTSTIRATSRASVKIRDNYFTVEYTEERVLPVTEAVDLEEERKALWETVNAECDNQIEEINQTFRK